MTEIYAESAAAAADGNFYCMLRNAAGRFMSCAHYADGRLVEWVRDIPNDLCRFTLRQVSDFVGHLTDTDSAIHSPSPTPVRPLTA